MVLFRSSHQVVYFNRVVSYLRLNFVKDLCKGVQFLVNLFFKVFDHKCGIPTSYHIFLQKNYFLQHHSKAASVFGKLGKILRQTSEIIRKVPCYQSTAVLRGFIVEVGVFQNACKVFPEQLPVKTFFNSCSYCFCWLFKVLNKL